MPFVPKQRLSGSVLYSVKEMAGLKSKSPLWFWAILSFPLHACAHLCNGVNTLKPVPRALVSVTS